MIYGDVTIVKEIAATHKAMVEIESGALGVGTCGTVTVTFPLMTQIGQN